MGGGGGSTSSSTSGCEGPHPSTGRASGLGGLKEEGIRGFLGFQRGGGSVAGVDGVVLFDLQKFLQGMHHFLGTVG